MKSIKHAILALAAMTVLAPTTTFAAEATGPTDAQIAHIAYTADNIDIKYAQLALKKSQDPNVREFAELMVRDHTAANKQALALVKKLGITPEDNDTSKAYAKQGADEYAVLEKLSGKAFDKAYAENELAYHHAVNGAVANVLIPSAKNKELKNLLLTDQAIFLGHEEHAKNMVASLSK
jgi:putative membrane protein